jgi:hypothetical protein
MINIYYYENNTAGKVYFINEVGTPLYTVWRIANQSCNGSCRENREVITFKSMELAQDYLTNLHLDRSNFVSYLFLENELGLITCDSIELKSGEFLFDGLATTVFHPVLKNMIRAYN